MSTIKNLIPSEDALKERCALYLKESISTLLSDTDSVRTLAKETGKKAFLSFLTLLGSAVFLNILEGVKVFSSIGTVVFVISLLLIFYYGYKWIKAREKLSEMINKSMVPILAKVFSMPVEHNHAVEHQDETKSVFKESELVTEPVDNITIDDRYVLSSVLPLTVNEMMATKEVGSGKNKSTVVIFKGVFAVVELPKTLTGVTFISTEGDKSGFAHRSFWTRTLGLSNIKETILEWNEFEKDLHVATSDEVEARYILTTNFMVDLHTWWLERKENIRLSFRGNKLYLALPDGEVNIGISTASVKFDDLNKHLLATARPLWRILTLVEDVRL